MKKCVLVFCILLFSSCSQNILEYDQIADLHVNQFVEKDKLSIKISGLCMSSAYVVKDMSFFCKNDTMKLLINKSLLKRAGDSGNFSFVVNIPLNINYVIIGEKERIIWRRTD